MSKIENVMIQTENFGNEQQTENKEKKMPKAKSEYQVEEQYIERLKDMGYEYVELAHYEDVLSNFRKQFCKLNRKALTEAKGMAELSDAEFDRIIMRLDNHTVYESAKILREQWILELDNGKRIYVAFFTGDESKNIYQKRRKRCRKQNPNIR